MHVTFRSSPKPVSAALRVCALDLIRVGYGSGIMSELGADNPPKALSRVRAWGWRAKLQCCILLTA